MLILQFSRSVSRVSLTPSPTRLRGCKRKIQSGHSAELGCEKYAYLTMYDRSLM